MEKQKRIALDADSAKKRYKFARAWLHFEDLSNIMFSDESSVQRDPSNPTQWVFCFSNEAYRPDLVNLERHGKDILIMIWAPIWYGGRWELVVLERDELSRNGGYSTNSYIACLEKGLLPIYEPGMRFQQDNAKIHISRQAQSWFERHGIWVLEWPPYSPDLNPIENLWRLLKKKLKELYPGLFLDGLSEIDIERFRQVIQTAWNSLDQEVINRLVLSWPRRLRAVY